MSSYDIDSLLIDRLNKGDESAFETLFHTFYSILCNYALTILKDKDEIEDIVQNVFINLNQRIAKGLKFDSIAHVKTYIYKSVRNSCLNYIRDKKRRKYDSLESELVTDDMIQDIELEIIRHEIISLIYQEINKLPQACRKIFMHSYIDEWTDKQIAEEYHISLNTIKTQKSRAKKALRKSLGQILF